MRAHTHRVCVYVCMYVFMYVTYSMSHTSTHVCSMYLSKYPSFSKYIGTQTHTDTHMFNIYQIFAIASHTHTHAHTHTHTHMEGPYIEARNKSSVRAWAFCPTCTKSRPTLIPLRPPSLPCTYHPRILLCYFQPTSLPWRPPWLPSFLQPYTYHPRTLLSYVHYCLSHNNWGSVAGFPTIFQ